MISARTAEENLNLIRSLMERATLYRTVSVPAAAWGGFLSVAAWGLEKECLTSFPEGLRFLALWLGVLVLTACGNLFFLRHEARQTGSLIFSPGFWTAWRSLFPAFFCAGFFTVIGLRQAGPEILALLWIFFYGLGLLATQHFAPRSIVALGWLFLLTPLLFIGLTVFGKTDLIPFPERDSTLMALTFGGYHLGYALVVFLLERRRGRAVPHGL